MGTGLPSWGASCWPLQGPLSCASGSPSGDCSGAVLAHLLASKGVRLAERSCDLGASNPDREKNGSRVAMDPKRTLTHLCGGDATKWTFILAKIWREGMPFLSTKTVGKKCHNTFTRINSLGRVSRQAPEDNVRLLCFEAIVVKRPFGFASVPVPLLLTAQDLTDNAASIYDPRASNNRPQTGTA
jgi:hypothetical protein